MLTSTGCQNRPANRLGPNLHNGHSWSTPWVLDDPTTYGTPPEGQHVANLLKGSSRESRMARAAVRKGVCPPPSLLLPESPASRAVDFNSDGAFDAGDLPRWITGFGSTSALFSNGDGDADGDVDGADYLTWQREFGKGQKVPQVCKILEITEQAYFR